MTLKRHQVVRGLSSVYYSGMSDRMFQNGLWWHMNQTSLSCLQSQQLEPKWLLCIVKSWYKPAQWNGFTAMQQSPSGLVTNPDWVPVSQYAGEHTLHCTIGLHPFDTTDGSSGESYNLNRILLKVRVIDFKASNCILLNWIWRSSILSYLLFWTVV